MSVKHTIVLITITFLSLIPSLTGWAAPFGDEQAPDRKTRIEVPYVEYEWWLTHWEDNQVACQIITDQEGVPSHQEIYDDCGEEIFQTWLETPICTNDQQDVEQEEAGGEKNTQESQEQKTEACKGYYLHLNATRSKTREVVVDLPTPEVWISVPGCQLLEYTLYCDQKPSILLTAEEPLPNERIVEIAYEYDGKTGQCLGDQCQFYLQETEERIIDLSFWALSSYGDASGHYTAKVKVLPPEPPTQRRWQISILSSHWKNEELACCSDIWHAFPPPEGMPTWLQTPEDLKEMTSNEPYVYLAGRLIASGAVEAETCPAGGLAEDGAANTCGLEKARHAVAAWQNRFDRQLLETAKETGVPGQLMKNLIGRESQFWPGIFTETRQEDQEDQEHGLSQMTRWGADGVLFWNESFYAQFCPLVLADHHCENRYVNLDESKKELLRLALAAQASVDCADCAYGLDLENVGFSIDLLAEALLANCEQVGQIVYNITGEEPGQVSSYEDLWRFTLVNYNAGPGCLADTINAAWRPGSPLTWEGVSASLTGGCSRAIDYVDNIAQE